METRRELACGSARCYISLLNSIMKGVATHLVLRIKPFQSLGPKQSLLDQELYHIWRSRDNRKGRHALALTPLEEPSSSTRPATPPPTTATNTPRATLEGISRMFLRFPIWDVSYDVAAICTLGSAVWVRLGLVIALRPCSLGAQGITGATFMAPAWSPTR
ncbi:hypothetical protein F5883DRAFT_543248 [Diaporthe sp. PMI_573]|nr:hypothetical protein F5883DRAFT_543248 [Diaporthaceae sp. PMI_573]